MKIFLIAALCVVPVVAAEDLPWTPAPEKSYFQQAFGLGAFERAAGSAVFAEIVNTPREWGRTWEGAGKRVGSAYGKHLVSTSVRYSVATLRHEDLRYFPSASKSTGARLRHALISVVVAKNTETGVPMMAMGRVSGAFAGGFVSRTWMPDRYHTFQSGLTSGGLSLGIEAGVNLFREFFHRKR